MCVIIHVQLAVYHRVQSKNGFNKRACDCLQYSLVVLRVWIDGRLLSHILNSTTYIITSLYKLTYNMSSHDTIAM